MVIFNQPIDTSEVQLEPKSIVLFIFLLVGFISIAATFYGLSYRFTKKHNAGEEVDPIVDILKACAGLIIFIFIAALLIVNAHRVITPLQSPVYKKTYATSFFGELGTQHIDKPSFTDKYKDDINKAVEDKLDNYTIPSCMVDKPEKEASLLCGGYALDSVSAVDKETDKTYTLTPQFNYDYKTSTVELTVKEIEGYKSYSK